MFNFGALSVGSDVEARRNMNPAQLREFARRFASRGEIFNALNHRVSSIPSLLSRLLL
jgi:hypothetical protein